MAEHTPTPWVLAHRKGQAAVRGPSTECIAVLPYAACEGYGLTDVFEVGANAAYIVKAVNNHEAMLVALEAASEYLESDAADGFRPAHRLRAEIDTAIRNARVGGVSNGS